MPVKANTLDVSDFGILCISYIAMPSRTRQTRSGGISSLVSLVSKGLSHFHISHCMGSTCYGWPHLIESFKHHAGLSMRLPHVFEANRLTCQTVHSHTPTL